MRTRRLACAVLAVLAADPAALHAAELAAVTASEPAPVTTSEPAPVTTSELAAPLAAAPAAGAEPAPAPDERLVRAEEALDRGDLRAADALYRSILVEEPGHDAAYYALANINLGRELPRGSAALVAARVALPETFREYETAHYVVLSDADPSWTREQAARLERAHDRFIRFANLLEVRALPLRHKLVGVVFAGLEDFRAYGKADGLDVGARVAGYYWPAADRLVFYHVESNGNVAAARDELAGMLGEAEEVRRAARSASNRGRRESARTMRRELDERLRHLDENEQRLNAIAHEWSVRVTVHEAIHQLMFHCSVQSPFVEPPIWLTEGLAVAFETDDPSGEFGPGHDFAPRREAFWSLLDADGLLPLAELVALRHEDLAQRPDSVDAVYHQGYALVTWMWKTRRIQLRDYMLALKELPKGAQTSETLLAVFASAFGDPARLEEAWLRAERGEP